MDRSIDFYKKLGYTEARRQDSPQGNKLAFLELPGQRRLSRTLLLPGLHRKVSEDLMHTCLGVPDIVDYCDR